MWALIRIVERIVLFDLWSISNMRGAAHALIASVGLGPFKAVICGLGSLWLSLVLIFTPAVGWVHEILSIAG